jgi:hypothetical protein
MSKIEQDDFFFKLHIEQMDEDYWYVGIYGLHEEEILWAMAYSKKSALNKAIAAMKKEMGIE